MKVPTALQLAAICLLLAAGPVPVLASPKRDLSDGLIAYWPLDETSGTRADALGVNCGGGCDLADIGSVGYAIGQFDTAAAFSSTESLSVTDNAITSSDGFAVAMWVYVDSVPAEEFNPSIVVLGNEAGTSEWSVSQFTNLIFLNISGNTDNGIVFSQVELTSGNWYYVVAWYDAVAQTIGIDVNGQTDELAWTDGVIDVVNAPFRINVPDSIGFEGRIDELAYWDRALAADERELLYNDGNGLTYPFDIDQPMAPRLTLNVDFSQLFSLAEQLFNGLWPILGLALGTSLAVSMIITFVNIIGMAVRLRS